MEDACKDEGSSRYRVYFQGRSPKYRLTGCRSLAGPKGTRERFLEPFVDDLSSEAHHRSQRGYRQVFVTFPIGRPRSLQAATPVRPDLVVVFDKGCYHPLIFLQIGDRRNTRFPAHGAMPALYSRRGVSPAPLSEPDVRLSAHRALQ